MYLYHAKVIGSELLEPEMIDGQPMARKLYELRYQGNYIRCEYREPLPELVSTDKCPPVRQDLKLGTVIAVTLAVTPVVVHKKDMFVHTNRCVIESIENCGETDASYVFHEDLDAYFERVYKVKKIEKLTSIHIGKHREMARAAVFLQDKSGETVVAQINNSDSCRICDLKPGKVYMFYGDLEPDWGINDLGKPEDTSSFYILNFRKLLDQKAALKVFRNTSKH